MEVMLATRKSVAIGMREAYSLADSEIAVVPLADPRGNIEVCMAWQKGEKSQAVLSFLDHVRDAFRKPT